MKSRILALALALTMLLPGPALASTDLRDAFAAAGIELPDYAGAIDRLGREIRAAYGAPYDAEGRFRPGAFLVNLINGGGRAAVRSANPYLMPSDPDGQLAFMLAEGLMQYALDARADIWDAEGGDRAELGLTVDAGLDDDGCLVAEGTASYGDGDGGGESDGFFFRYNRRTGEARLKPPFGEASALEAWDAGAPEPIRILRRSVLDDGPHWTEAIDLAYAHLAAQPRIGPLLGWLLEGRSAPGGAALTEADLMPGLRQLLLDLGGDRAFTAALANTGALEALAAAKDAVSLPFDPAVMTAPERGAAIAALLYAGAGALQRADDPFEGLRLSISAPDGGPMALSVATGARDQDPARFDERFELALGGDGGARFGRATLSTPDESYTASISLGPDGADLSAAYDDGFGGFGYGSLALARDGADLALWAVGGGDVQSADLSARWGADGAWTLGGFFRADGEPFYRLDGAGDARSGRMAGAPADGASDWPGWRWDYADDGQRFTADARLVEGGEDASMPLSLRIDRLERGAALALSAQGMPLLSAGWNGDPKDLRLEFALDVPKNPVRASLRSAESESGARATSLSLTLAALGDAPLSARVRTEPLGDGEIGYEIDLDLMDVQGRIDGRQRIVRDLSLPVPLAVDQRGTLRFSADGGTVDGEYALEHRFEVKERKHRDPGPTAGARRAAEGDAAGFVPAETDGDPAD